MQGLYQLLQNGACHEEWIAFFIYAIVRDATLIQGAAILDQLRDLDIWMTLESVEHWRPCRLLADLLDVDGGYLAPLLR